MFTGKKILEYNANRDNKIISERDNYNLVKSHLNVINQAKLRKINKAIEKIIDSIKKDSYWEYIDGEFTYKSNFRYDSKHEDIFFTINSIKREGGKYIGVNNNEREERFISNYKELLKRLAILEDKKAELYDLARVMPIDKSIYLDKKAKIMPFNKIKQYEKDAEYFSKMSETFIRNYGIETIGELIYILNKIDNCQKPESVYKIISVGKTNGNVVLAG